MERLNNLSFLKCPKPNLNIIKGAIIETKKLEMPGFVYILECANGKYYTGSTINLEKRIREHKAGEGAKFTKKHLPVKLVFYEQFQTIREAFEMEKQLQGWSRKKKQALIDGDFKLLPLLSKKKFK